MRIYGIHTRATRLRMGDKIMNKFKKDNIATFILVLTVIAFYGYVFAAIVS